MTTQSSLEPTTVVTTNRRRDRSVGGAVLIILGVGLLVGPLTGWHFAWLVLPGLAAIFLTWGLFTRAIGPLIPGGILAGLATGILLTQAAPGVVATPASGALFLLCFAGGWALISLLSIVTTTGFQWWPLIPGTILALVGLAQMTNQMQMLSLLGYASPLLLIGLGIWLVLRKHN